MDIQAIVFKIAIMAPGFLLAVVIHEYAHGWMAKKFGDNTAEEAGRLTFNPVVHLDPINSILVPIVLLAIGGIALGAARPVPINTRNFSDFKKGLFWVSFAGPLSNLILGTILALIFAIIFNYVGSAYLFEGTFFQLKKGLLLEMFQYGVLINFILAGFNLIPVPPFDGSRMLESKLGYNALLKYREMSQYLVYAFYGLIILSFMGVPILGMILSPFTMGANVIINFFISILG